MSKLRNASLIRLDTDGCHKDGEVDDKDEELPHGAGGGELRPVARHHTHQART